MRKKLMDQNMLRQQVLRGAGVFGDCGGGSPSFAAGVSSGAAFAMLTLAGTLVDTAASLGSVLTRAPLGEPLSAMYSKKLVQVMLKSRLQNVSVSGNIPLNPKCAQTYPQPSSSLCAQTVAVISCSPSILRINSRHPESTSSWQRYSDFNTSTRDRSQPLSSQGTP